MPFSTIGRTNAKIPDTTPNAYGFVDVTGQERSSWVYSNIIQITGINVPVSAVSSGASSQICTFSDAGGASPISGWTTSTTIENGQYIRCRQYTSGTYSSSTAATVLVGGGSTTWYATTKAAAHGSISYTTPGTYYWTVPEYASMTASVSGAGGGGGGSTRDESDDSGGVWPGTDGTAGTYSSFNGNIIGYGGGGGKAGYSTLSIYTPGANGAAGTASGGSSNITGGGSAGGARGGLGPPSALEYGGYGGAGGRAVISYGIGAFTPGQTITIVVGTRGNGGTETVTGGTYNGGAGTHGRVDLSW